MTDKDREELISAIDNLNQLDFSLEPRAEIAKLKIERVLLRNPVSLNKDAPPSDSGYTCYSVPGGWRTRDRISQQFIGPAFNKFSDLLNWQKDNLYPDA